LVILITPQVMMSPAEVERKMTLPLESLKRIERAIQPVPEAFEKLYPKE
jgi:hypothetical protein